MSIPFFTGIISGFLSVTCLALAFKNELDNGSPENPLGLPAGVQTEVRIAQYMGVIIGVVRNISGGSSAFCFPLIRTNASVVFV